MTILCEVCSTYMYVLHYCRLIEAYIHCRRRMRLLCDVICSLRYDLGRSVRRTPLYSTTPVTDDSMVTVRCSQYGQATWFYCMTHFSSLLLSDASDAVVWIVCCSCRSRCSSSSILTSSTTAQLTSTTIQGHEYRIIHIRVYT